MKTFEISLKYVLNLRPEVRQIATEAILECSRLGYPLNDMEITSKAREMLRKKRMISWGRKLVMFLKTN